MAAAPIPEFIEVEPELYDALIDWPKRLGNETPLLREVMQRTGARRVLDAACGTGRHAALMHSWGLEVTGADASPGMIAHCRRHYGESERLAWVERRFDEGPRPQDARFDAVLCLGNSLALAPGRAEVERSVRAMLEWLRPGGALLLQVLNLEPILEGPMIWQKCLRTSLRGETHVLLKGIHRVGDRGHVDLVDLAIDRAELRPQHHQAEFLGMPPEWLVHTAQQERGVHIEVFGSYRKEPFAPARSTDLIALLTRADG